MCGEEGAGMSASDTYLGVIFTSNWAPPHWGSSSEPSGSGPKSSTATAPLVLLMWMIYVVEDVSPLRLLRSTSC